MLRSAGERGLTKFELKLLRWKEKIRSYFITEIKISDRQFESVFVCENDMQASRALSLWIKEAGTMEWLDSNLKPLGGAYAEDAHGQYRTNSMIL